VRSRRWKRWRHSLRSASHEVGDAPPLPRRARRLRVADSSLPRPGGRAQHTCPSDHHTYKSGVGPLVSFPCDVAARLRSRRGALPQYKTSRNARVFQLLTRAPPSSQLDASRAVCVLPSRGWDLRRFTTPKKARAREKESDEDGHRANRRTGAGSSLGRLRLAWGRARGSQGEKRRGRCSGVGGDGGTVCLIVIGRQELVHVESTPPNIRPRETAVLTLKATTKGPRLLACLNVRGERLAVALWRICDTLPDLAASRA
jgi:hypothetical protein